MKRRRPSVKVVGFKDDYRLCREHGLYVVRLPGYYKDLPKYKGADFSCPYGDGHGVAEKDTYFAAKAARAMSADAAEAVVRGRRTDIFGGDTEIIE